MNGSLPHRAFKAERVKGEKAKLRSLMTGFPPHKTFKAEHVKQVMENFRRRNSNRRIGEYHMVISTIRERSYKAGIVYEWYCGRAIQHSFNFRFNWKLFELFKHFPA